MSSPAEPFIIKFRFFRTEDRSDDDIEQVYEDIMNIKAFSHLSNTVKKELSGVIAFESHKEKSTTCKCTS